ncbi:LPD7 domain-containing protein (plasmid) [Pseudomonas alloputida]|uniref:LPD7 domain-containing protein n=1 Tax=Pseudomonas alloputida TaxID=1940621 RepID=UPI003B43AA91
MIIRYGGGNKGIKEYLEEGRKADRHMSRDELDRRVPIDGDLVVTQSVIDTIKDEGQDRYLHISMSFNEPGITEDDITRVYQQYREQLMTAYGDDEYNIYAEIHWPKVKESYNHKTQQMEPRFPHVHIVVPKKNVLTNRFLNPTGMHEKSVKYFDAIQEKLNRDNGLSSPRLSPRVGANHYESALDKYKEKEFKSKNGELKRNIHAALLERDIRTVAAFKDLVSEYGEVKVRNAGKANEYLAVKLVGDQKFTNLNANIFSAEYIKDRSLVIDPISDAQVAKRVQTWRDIQSREIKYISNASAKVKAHYRDLPLPERRQFLDKRESDYAKRYRKPEATVSTGKTKLPSLRERSYLPSDLKSAFRPEAERAGDLYELRTRNVDHFGAGRDAANRLFLQGDADNDLLHLEADRGSGLRRDLYAGEGGGGSRAGGSGRAGRVVPDLATDPQSSVLTSLIQAEADKALQANDLQRFAEIRKNLNAEHLLAFAQLKFGVDPAQHAISKAKDGSARIKVGKYNYNVSDFLTKHIGLEWPEAAKLLEELYEKQQTGIVEKPRPKVVLLADWMKFREEIYPQNIRTYNELKNEIKISFALGLKAINAEYFARKKNITQDQSLSRADKHYLRSVVILEKLQKVEALQQRIDEQNSLKNRVKYPYSTLFYDYATKNEAIDMKILDKLKARHTAPLEPGVNSIGGKRPATPHQMPNGAEAMKRARLVAKLHAQERVAKELRIKLSDLRHRPQQDGSVAFVHKDHGKQIFVNHPDRVELNRVTDPDEVGVGLMYSIERFGNPLEISGTEEFKRQVIEVAAERDMDITFTDEALNKALEAKRIELGLEPLAGNTITVQTPELDTSVPLTQAVDQALLASRVAELDAIRNGIPYSMTEVAMHQDMVAEALERHQEVEAGFIDNDRIREIAQLDLDAYTYLQGKPEQQPLALAMADMKSNGPYSDYVNEHGPAEFKLTVDATRFMIARDGQLATQQPVAPVQEPEQVAPAAQAPAPAPAAPAQPAATTAAPSFKEMTEAEVGQNSLKVVNLRMQEERLTASLYDQEQGGAAEETLAPMRAELNAVQIERHELMIDLAPNLKAQHLAAPNPDAAYVQSLDREVELSTAALVTLRQAAPDIEPAAAAPVESELAQPAPSAPEPLTFTHNGEPAVLDLSRFQAPAPATQPEPSAAAPVEAEPAQPESLSPEPLTFTHNGEPAVLDLSRFQAPTPEATQPEPATAPVEAEPAQPDSLSPEPLTFTHNGEPAVLDLSRYQAPAPATQPEPAAAAPVEVDAVTRASLEAEWNAMQQYAMLQRDESQRSTREGLLKALNDRKLELKAESAEATRALPLRERLMNLVAADVTNIERNQQIGYINNAMKALTATKHAHYTTISEVQERDRKYDQGNVLRYGEPMSDATGELAMTRDEWVADQARQRLTGAGLEPAPVRAAPTLEALAEAQTLREGLYKQYVNDVVDKHLYLPQSATYDQTKAVFDTAQQIDYSMAAQGSVAQVQALPEVTTSPTYSDQDLDAAVRIDQRAELVADLSVSEREAQLQPEVVKSWVAADHNDYQQIQAESVRIAAEDTLTSNTQLTPAYKQELQQLDSALAQRLEAPAPSRFAAGVEAESYEQFVATESSQPIVDPSIYSVDVDRYRGTSPETAHNAIVTDDMGAVWDGEKFNSNIDPEETEMYTPYEALQLAFELEKTQAERLQGNPVEVQRYMPTEGRGYKVLDTDNGKILPFATMRMKEYFDLDLDRAKFLDARDNAQARIDLASNARVESVAPLNFTHNGQPAELDLTRFAAGIEGQREQFDQRVEHQAENYARFVNGEGRAVDDSAPKLSAEAGLKVIELRDINERFANEGPDAVYDSIVRQGTLTDSELRHDEISTKEMVGDSAGLKETARLDLEAYARLEGKPEQQSLALAMSRAMEESETYSEYVTENAPEGFAVMVEASQAISDEQQTKAPTGPDNSSDFDM